MALLYSVRARRFRWIWFRHFLSRKDEYGESCLWPSEMGFRKKRMKIGAASSTHNILPLDPTSVILESRLRNSWVKLLLISMVHRGSDAAVLQTVAAGSNEPLLSSHVQSWNSRIHEVSNDTYLTVSANEAAQVLFRINGLRDRNVQLYDSLRQ